MRIEFDLKPRAKMLVNFSIKFIHCFILFFLVCSKKLFAETVSLNDVSKLSISGYLETYYLHDFNHPSDDIRPSFTYSHNAVGKQSINLGFIKANFNQIK